MFSAKGRNRDGGLVCCCRARGKGRGGESEPSAMMDPFRQVAPKCSDGRSVEIQRPGTEKLAPMVELAAIELRGIFLHSGAGGTLQSFKSLEEKVHLFT